MASKARSKEFRFMAWTSRRYHFDDEAIVTGEHLDADRVQEFRGVVLVPCDPQWDTKSTAEPYWDLGGFLQEAATGKILVGWTFTGRPPEAIISCWREDRQIDGVLIGSLSRDCKR